MSLARIVSLVLGGACALLALAAGLLFAGFGAGVDPVQPDTAAPERPLPSLDREADVGLDAMTAYAAVAERPLFDDDRRPDPDRPREIVEDPDGAGGPGGAETPVAPLEVAVKGIIITPDLKLAIVTDTKANSTLRLREGMPLEGDQAAWRLEEIQPRRLVFDGGDERAEVELVVNTKALAGAPAVTNRTADAPQDEEALAEPGAEPEEIDAAARAEEIRRRVAERRAQLREEAARRRAARAERDNDDG